jgi:hypothetical protein
VSEPEGDYGAINPILKKVHCRGMAKHMRADVFPFERGARSGGRGGIFRDQTLDRITAQLSASGTEKQRIFGPAAAFVQPSPQYLCGFRPQGRASVFSAFSLAVNMRAGSQHDILTLQAYQLGNPEAGLNGEQEHCPITSANPSGEIDGSQHGLTLFAGEKFDGPTFVAFGGQCQDLLAKQRMRWLLESDVLKERMNRRQADVASASAVLSAILEVVEEITDKTHVQIFEREVRWRFAQPFFCEMQEQAEGVTIPRYGVRTRPPLPNQAICKERLKKRRKAVGGHDRSSFSLANRRSVAN